MRNRSTRMIALATTVLSTLLLLQLDKGFASSGEHDLPDRIAGYEVVLLKAPENTPCLAIPSIHLRVSQSTVQDFLSSSSVDVIRDEMRSLGIPDEVRIAVSGPGALPKEEIIKRHQEWAKKLEKSGCIPLGRPSDAMGQGCLD